MMLTKEEKKATLAALAWYRRAKLAEGKLKSQREKTPDAIKATWAPYERLLSIVDDATLAITETVAE